MAVLTAGKSIKGGFLSGIGEPSNVWADTLPDAADEEYQRDVQYLYEDSLDMVLRKVMPKSRLDELMIKCRDREFVKRTAKIKRESQRLFEICNAWANKVGLTEEDVNEAIEEAKQEERERNGW